MRYIEQNEIPLLLLAHFCREVLDESKFIINCMKTPKKCPECNGANIIRNKSKEFVCKSCGLVLDEKNTDTDSASFVCDI